MNQTDKREGNILIVDDTKANLDVLSGILKEQGYKVRPAPNGNLALRAVKAEKPDLILLDIRMPGMDGYEVCREIKADEEYQDIPIIFISALTDTADKLEAFQAGGVDYVTKPFHAEEVLARVSVQLELQKTLEQLEHAREIAEAANIAKSTFLRNMSHELRSPLNIILGYANMMQRFSRTLPNEHRENISAIIHSSEHLRTLIDNVLDLSRIESGVITLEEGPFDLHHLLNDLEDMFALRAENQNLEFHFDIADDVPKFVIGDSVKLRQVLINLLSNAVTFTKDGGVLVQVNQQASKKKGADSTTIEFEVRDSGPGIPANEQNKIFEPFFQGEAGKKAQAGTGLGLAICKEFVTLFDSDLILESDPKKGSSFSFSVSMKVTDELELEDHEAGPTVMALAPNQPTYKILVADDKWANRQILFKLLQPLGFDLREARNGREAVDVFEEWQPDLVWMHLRMPEMDGFEATRLIKGKKGGEDTTVIAVTASAFDEERAIIDAIGSDDFLRRPYRIEDVFAMLEKHLKVKYVYQDDPSPDYEAKKDLVPIGDMSAISKSLIDELESALSKLDVDAINQAVDKIKKKDKGIGSALEIRVREFDYDGILSHLKDQK